MVGAPVVGSAFNTALVRRGVSVGDTSVWVVVCLGWVGWQGLLVGASDFQLRGHCGVIKFQPVEDVELVDRPATET